MEKVNGTGFYTALRPFNSEEKALFEKMIGDIHGVKHTPLAVATQLVAGTNYAFLCESIVLHPDAVSYNTLVIIHQPFPHENKTPILLEIREIKVI